MERNALHLLASLCLLALPFGEQAQAMGVPTMMAPIAATEPRPVGAPQSEVQVCHTKTVGGIIVGGIAGALFGSEAGNQARCVMEDLAQDIRIFDDGDEEPDQGPYTQGDATAYSVTGHITQQGQGSDAQECVSFSFVGVGDQARSAVTNECDSEIVHSYFCFPLYNHNDGERGWRHLVLRRGAFDVPRRCSGDITETKTHYLDPNE